ncbi:dTDP-4-dehydrorhamnose reductase [Paraburkholderia tropica]|uniref:dTDP-4-dehydrorhamnose reductase n=1 Tax=Paraburkholderia tropica TaxID=92647 RepID=UPI002AB1525E|nr:dTDP-4-dehydrorhamnose reductase [Paraburkholderia tropica]
MTHALANSGKRVILLTGVGGQVGFELARSLQGLGTVIAVDRARIDLSDLDQVRRVVREVRPQLIVNPAAYTSVDAAESDVDTAMRVNAQAPGVLAEEAARLGAKLVHFSTDYVFDGTKSAAYVEDDAPNPLNVYGRSKLAGEKAIAAAANGYLIFRTSWVYGLLGKNFLLTMLRLGAERDELRVVDDQFGSPTWSATISAMSVHVLAQAIAAGTAGDKGWDMWWERHQGIYNLTAAGVTSWHGFAEAIFEMSGREKRPVVVRTSARDYPTPAARPGSSRLAGEKLAAVFGLSAPSWRDALHQCLNERRAR